MYDSYEAYYASTTYDQRYPKPNPRTLKYILNVVRTTSHSEVLDIGAGNGRYALPLAALTSKCIWAIERSDEARRQLGLRAARLNHAGDLQIAADLEDVSEQWADVGVVLFVFGVLSHMSSDERREILTQLRDLLPATARLIGSVPNKYRRFRNEQRLAQQNGSDAGRITYARDLGTETALFEYTLFSPHSLGCELRASGWAITHMCPESCMPESAVARSPRIAWADRQLTRLIPARLGYGLLFTAVPATA